jgi:hypothetical protein
MNTRLVHLGNLNDLQLHLQHPRYFYQSDILGEGFSGDVSSALFRQEGVWMLSIKKDKIYRYILRITIDDKVGHGLELIIPRPLLSYLKLKDGMSHKYLLNFEIPMDMITANIEDFYKPDGILFNKLKRGMPKDCYIDSTDYVFYDQGFTTINAPPLWYLLNHHASYNMELQVKKKAFCFAHLSRVWDKICGKNDRTGNMYTLGDNVHNNVHLKLLIYYSAEVEQRIRYNALHPENQIPFYPAPTPTPTPTPTPAPAPALNSSDRYVFEYLRLRMDNNLFCIIMHRGLLRLRLDELTRLMHHIQKLGTIAINQRRFEDILLFLFPKKTVGGVPLKLKIYQLRQHYENVANALLSPTLYSSLWNRNDFNRLFYTDTEDTEAELVKQYVGENNFQFLVEKLCVRTEFASVLSVIRENHLFPNLPIYPDAKYFEDIMRRAFPARVKLYDRLGPYLKFVVETLQMNTEEELTSVLSVLSVKQNHLFSDAQYFKNVIRRAFPARVELYHRLGSYFNLVVDTLQINTEEELTTIFYSILKYGNPISECQLEEMLSELFPFHVQLRLRFSRHDFRRLVHLCQSEPATFKDILDIDDSENFENFEDLFKRLQSIDEYETLRYLFRTLV